MKELSLADCGKLTDGALEAITTVCSALNVKEAANQTILALVSNTHETLLRLDVSGDHNSTDEALGLLADSFSLLQEFILFGCTQVTDNQTKDTIESLRAELQRLQAKLQVIEE